MNKIPLFYFSMLFLSASGVCACYSFVLNDESPNQMIVENSEVNLGECEQGSTQHASFRIKNRMKMNVEIIRVTETCSCASSDISRRLLRPEEESDITVLWRVGHHRGKRVLPVEFIFRPAAIAQEQALVVKATAVVRGDIEFTPSRLDFFSNRPETKTIEIQRRTGRYNVYGAVANHHALTAKCDSNSSKVEVTFAPDHWKNPAAEIGIDLITDRPDEPRIRIPILIRAAE